MVVSMPNGLFLSGKSTAFDLGWESAKKPTEKHKTRENTNSDQNQCVSMTAVSVRILVINGFCFIRITGSFFGSLDRCSSNSET